MRPSGRPRKTGGPTGLGPRIRRVGCIEELPDWQAKLERAAQRFEQAHRRSAASNRAAGDRLTDSYALIAASLRQAAALLGEQALKVNMLAKPRPGAVGLVFMVRCPECLRLCLPTRGTAATLPYHRWRRKRCLGAGVAADKTEAYHVAKDNTMTPCPGYYEGCTICRAKQ